MRILCVSNDIPLPANSGGRVDVWRRLRVLAAAGHEVALLCWYDAGRVAEPDAAVFEELLKVCATVKVLPIRRTSGEILARLWHFGRLPSHVAARRVTSTGQGVQVWCDEFKPDVVLLDGLYGGAVALDLANHIGCPLLYRSHNIENKYMTGQARREGRLLRRLGLYANLVGLGAFERRVMTSAERVFDISHDDQQYWAQQGFHHVEWLPTTVDEEFIAALKIKTGDALIDILYFGNLNTPNNVEAVTWLVRKVLPLIKVPTLRVVIAGSRPADSVRRLMTEDSRLVLTENPANMASVVSRAKVLVNPMKAGSGVNLKSVEMLFTDAALVSTSIGVLGLPPDAKACFEVADEASAFATAIERSLAGAAIDLERRFAVRQPYSPQACKSRLDRWNGITPSAAALVPARLTA